MSEIDNLKKQFIENEILTSSIIGAFSRNKVYKENIDERQRNLFKQYVRKSLTKYKNLYKIQQNYNIHIQRIVKIKNQFSKLKEFRTILNKDEISLGTAQKILNLYLKYLWVLGYIPEPSHCPIDGIVLKKLRETNKKLPEYWTKINKEQEYQACIDEINKIRGDLSIAQWELKFWNDFSKKS